MKFERYLFSYYHNGSWWSFDIPATSLEDARERIVLLQRARYDGIVECVIPAGCTTSWLVSALCWIRNRLRITLPLEENNG